MKRLVPAKALIAAVALLLGLRTGLAGQEPRAVQEWNGVTLNPTPESEVRRAATKAPAPPRSLAGVWDAGGGRGIQARGAVSMPSDGAPEHRLPFTPAGEAAFKESKPGWGVTEVAPGLINDPTNICDPGGFPRADLSELRTQEIVQLPDHVLILYQFQRVWRTIWTDGRALPQDPESRWYGYSVGRWIDDYTFVVQTTGMDERTWVDNAGRRHSGAALKVEERFHRADRDTLELTVTIDDPVYYTKPWVAMDKFSLLLMPPGFDIREHFCSASEAAEYMKIIANPVTAGKEK